MRTTTSAPKAPLAKPTQILQTQIKRVLPRKPKAKPQPIPRQIFTDFASI
ncbi:hypothetical protein [Pelagivirga sediminicola]|nr:hypothetical protein [Pelagivirga sediminicola]